MPHKMTDEERFDSYLRQNNIVYETEDEYDYAFYDWNENEERLRNEEEARQQRLFERTYAVEDGMPFPVSYYDREEEVFDSDSDEEQPKRNCIVVEDSDDE